jgi:hypothetical protein
VYKNMTAATTTADGKSPDLGFLSGLFGQSAGQGGMNINLKSIATFFIGKMFGGTLGGILAVMLFGGGDAQAAPPAPEPPEQAQEQPAAQPQTSGAAP